MIEAASTGLRPARRRVAPEGVFASGLFAVGSATVASVLWWVGGSASTLLGPTLAVASLVAIAIGLRRHASRRRLPWALLALGQLCLTIGELMWATTTAGREPTLPVFGPFDLPYVLGYGLTVAFGVVLVAGRRGDGARWDIVDGLIIAAGLGLLWWELGLKPFVQTYDLSLPQFATAASYAVLMVLSVSFLARLGFRRRARTPAFWLFALSLLCTLAAYGSFGASERYAPGQVSDLLWALGYAFRGAAALHPSMVRLSEPGPRPPAGLTCARLWLFGAVALIPPVFLALAPLQRLDVVAAAAFGSLTVVLVQIRMASLVWQIEGRAVELDRRGARLVQAIEALKRSEQQRRHLAGRIERAQEEERRRIALDVHDDSLQAITALGLRVDLLRDRLTDPTQIAAAEEVARTLKAATGRLRNLMFELSPDLERLGLAGAVDELLWRTSAEAPIRPRLTTTLTREPPHEIRSAAYRIIKEAVTNVRRHARATALEVRLEPLDGGMRIVVTDDGRGFDVSSAPSAGHLGLCSITERADAHGGWARVRSEPGAGTTVEAWLPLPDEVAAP